MRAFNGLLGSVVIVALAAGCSFKGKGSAAGPLDVEDAGAGGSGSGGWMRPVVPDGGGFGGLIMTGPGPDAAVEPNDDANCGAAMVMLEQQPPDILVVLDRSGSMMENALTGDNCPNNDPTCVTKWDDMRSGLQEVFTATDATVNWGLKFFASGNNACNVNNTAEVPVAPNNAAAIIARMTAATANSGTPTRAAMTGATAYMQTLTSTNPKFILLATDGMPTCLNNDREMDDSAAAIPAVAAAAAAGFPTFVVGIATTGTTGHDTLSQMAIMGGKPRAADPPYYPVTTRADLVAALAEIGKATASCTLPLTTPPPLPDNVGVRVMGDQKVPHDATRTEGWEYGPNQTSIILYGSYCMNVMMGTYTDVRALYGCKGVMID